MTREFRPYPLIFTERRKYEIWHLKRSALVSKQSNVPISKAINLGSACDGLIGAAHLGSVHFLSPDQQSGIHCLIICAIQLLTPNNLGGTKASLIFAQNQPPHSPIGIADELKSLTSDNSAELRWHWMVLNGVLAVILRHLSSLLILGPKLRHSGCRRIASATKFSSKTAVRNCIIYGDIFILLRKRSLKRGTTHSTAKIRLVPEHVRKL